MNTLILSHRHWQAGIWRGQRGVVVTLERCAKEPVYALMTHRIRTLAA